MELSRLLTKDPDHVAVLAAESEGTRDAVRRVLERRQVSAIAVLEAAKGSFQGRGGGNPASATAVGEPGEPLRAALEAARAAALPAASATPSSASPAAASPDGVSRRRERDIFGKGLTPGPNHFVSVGTNERA